MKKIFLFFSLLYSILTFSQATIKNYPFDTYSYYEIIKKNTVSYKITLSESYNPNYILNLDMDTKEFINQSKFYDFDKNLEYTFKPEKELLIIGLDTTLIKTQNIYEYINKYKIRTENFRLRDNLYKDKVTYTKTSNGSVNIYEIKIYKSIKKNERNPYVLYIETEKIKNQLAQVNATKFSYLFYKYVLNEFDTNEIITKIHSTIDLKYEPAFSEKLIKIKDIKFDLNLEIPTK